MATLNATMPTLHIPANRLRVWGRRWSTNTYLVYKNVGGTGGVLSVSRKQKNVDSFAKLQSVRFGYVFDAAFGKALANFLGNISIEIPNAQSLLPCNSDCVEVGAVRIVGGIRPQNYDAAYRPDGPRVVFDSKTLNDKESIGKNWQNMINDLATEAATVHTRFPYAIVSFLIVLPEPALMPKQKSDIVRTLERLATRKSVIDHSHLAETIGLITWNPATGTYTEPSALLNLANFSTSITECYIERYKGLPPHD